MSAADIVGAPESSIALFAHPDDPDFMAGGTIARWTDAGCSVSYVIMTDGRAGTQGIGDDPMPEAELIRRRQEEQRTAGKLLGVEDIVFLDHHDGELFHTLELRHQLVREIRKRKPEAAVLFDPRQRLLPGYVQHPDHWISGEAALAAIFPLAGVRRAFTDLLADGLEPHAVRDIYLVSPLAPNLRLDITATIDRKIAAMQAHRTQVADPAGLAERMSRAAQIVADGSPYEYAEAFHFTRRGERELVLEY
ncbi:MAG TPA: PIG-L deacetylase family protein [Thermomicrobiales bacterium]|nr:PIG-L deacetylase family protein [Thermomicrobiales bacterium]